MFFLQFEFFICCPSSAEMVNTIFEFFLIKKNL